MKKYFIFLISGLWFFSLSAFSCSNVFIASNGYAVVGRSMDLDLNTGNVFGLGLAGQTNISDVNMPQKGRVNPAKWTNQYSYIGQTSFAMPIITDGLNEKGLYGGYLYLPNIAQYPFYNPKDQRPELSIADTLNYVLGTSADVKEAIQNLEKVQLVFSALQIKKFFAIMPIHLVLRDRSGHSAVIEWLDGKTKIYPNAGNVLTNSPAYDWQVKNAEQYNYLFSGNTDRKWDGIHMNGSGFYGLPGDWTPPSRFVRATVLIKHFPKPETTKQAMFLADQVLSSVIVPLGANPSSTLWITLSDLRSGTYYFRPLYYIVSNKNHVLTVRLLTPFESRWQSYNVSQIAKRYRNGGLPKGWVSARIMPGTEITDPKKVISELNAEVTPGKMRMKVKFVN